MVGSSLNEWLCLAGLLWMGAQGGRLLMKMIFIQRITSGYAQGFFCLIFAVIVSMYAVVLLDAGGLDIFSSYSSLVLCQGLMVVLISCVSIIGPFWLLWSSMIGGSFVLDGPSQSQKGRGIASKWLCTVVVGTCVTAMNVFVWKALPDLRLGTPLEIVASKIAYIGSMGTGLLGGYAAFATPYGFLRPHFMRGSADEAVQLLGALTKRQRTLLNLWSQRRQKIARLRQSPAPVQGSSGWFTRMRLAVGLGPRSVTVDELETESEGIQRVSVALFLQMQETQNVIDLSGDRLRNDQVGNIASRRVVLPLLRVATLCFGFALSLYACAKVAQICVSVGQHVLFRQQYDANEMSHSPSGGAVGRAVSWFLWLGDVVNGGDGVSAARRNAVRLAVAFHALMITMSLRGFLLTIFRLSTMYGRGAADTTFTVVAFSTSMGAFFVAQIIMMRSQLPPERDCALLAVFHNVELNRYQRTNDVCFLFACVGSFLVTRFLLRE